MSASEGDPNKQEVKNDFSMRCRDALEKILKLYNTEVIFNTHSGGTRIFIEKNDEKKVPAIVDKKMWKEDQKNADKFYKQSQRGTYQYEYKELLLPRSGADIYKSITKLLNQPDISQEEYTNMLIKIYNKLSPKTEATKGLSTLFGMRARDANTAAFNKSRIIEIRPLLIEAFNMNEKTSDNDFNERLKQETAKRNPSVFQRLGGLGRR